MENSFLGVCFCLFSCVDFFWRVYTVGRIWAGHNVLNFDCPRIREAFVEIWRNPPEPRGIIDSLALLTQRFGVRADDMEVTMILKRRTYSSELLKSNVTALLNAYSVLLWPLFGQLAEWAAYFGLSNQTHSSLDDIRMNFEVLKCCATVLFLVCSLILWLTILCFVLITLLHDFLHIF